MRKIRRKTIIRKIRILFLLFSICFFGIFLFLCFYIYYCIHLDGVVSCYFVEDFELNGHRYTHQVEVSEDDTNLILGIFKNEGRTCIDIFHGGKADGRHKLVFVNKYGMHATYSTYGKKRYLCFGILVWNEDGIYVDTWGELLHCCEKYDIMCSEW